MRHDKISGNRRTLRSLPGLFLLLSLYRDCSSYYPCSSFHVNRLGLTKPWVQTSSPALPYKLGPLAISAWFIPSRSSPTKVPPGN